MRTLIIILLFFSQLCLNAQSWDWAEHSPGNSGNPGKNIDEDASSNVYVTGTFTGTITFGAITLSSSTQNSYLAKLSPSGTYLWAKKINANINDIAVDNDIVIAGGFSDTLMIDGNIYVSTGSGDGFVAKLDLNGNFIWLQQAKGTGNDVFTNLHRNAAGDIFTTGSAGNTMQINSNNFTTGAFVIVFNAAGAITDNMEVGINCNGWEISSDLDDNIYLLCGFTDSINIGGSMLYAAYYGSHFLAKYHRNGNLIWVKNLGGNYYYPFRNLIVTHAGDIYLSKDNRYSSIELLKLSTAGNLKWSKFYGGSVYDECADLELDDQENIYMTGGFWYSASYGGIPVSGLEGCMYLAKIDSSGVGIWVKAAKPDSNGNVSGIKVSFKNSGHGYLFGSSSNSHLDSYSVSGLFIAKLAISTATSVREVAKENDQVNVFPNPTSGLITVDVSMIKTINKDILVYNNFGKCVYQKLNVPSENSITIDLSNLPKGIYYIELIADKNKQVKKVIVE